MKILFKICYIWCTIAAIIHLTDARKYLADKPDYFNPCLLQDPNFSKCFGKNFQVITSVWKDGIPGLKEAGTFDPLLVKRIVITQDPQNSVNLNAELDNLVITGASQIEVKTAAFNPKTLVSKLKLYVPKLHFDSDYKLDGRILNLPLNGNGKAVFEVEKFEMIVALKLKLSDEHGFTFSDVDKLKIDISDIGGLRVHLYNLFNGQKDLEESTNAILNQNWRDFYAVLRPTILKSMQTILFDRLSKAYSYVPGNYFISDLPTAASYQA